MRTVANLLARDAGVSSDQSLTDKIEVFVGDAYDIEARLGEVSNIPLITQVLLMLMLLSVTMTTVLLLVLHLHLSNQTYH